MADCCEVCGARYITADPPGTANEELHHVIPRAYGGKHGPLISLCDSCHTRVHKIANSLPANDSSICNNLPDSVKSKLTWLATVVYDAKKATANDPNKQLPVTFKISRMEAQRIERLKHILNVKSRKDVYAIALDRLFKSYIRP